MFEQVVGRGTATLATVFTAALLGWAGSAAAYEVTSHGDYLDPRPVTVTSTGDVFVGGLRQGTDGNYYLGTGVSSNCGDFLPEAISLGFDGGRPWNIVAADDGDGKPVIWVAGDQTLFSADPETCQADGNSIAIPRAEVANKGLAIDQDQESAYLANPDCIGCGAPNTVSVVDLQEGSSVNVSLEDFADPRGVAVSPDGSEVYVAATGNGKVWSLDTSDDQTLPIASDLALPEQVVFSPDGSTAYVTEASFDLAVIDTETRALSRIELTEGNSKDVAISPDGSLVYVLNSFGSSISIVSTTSEEEVAKVAIPSDRVSALAVSPSGNRAWVTAQQDEKLYEVRLGPGAPISLAATPSSSSASVAFTPGTSNGSAITDYEYSIDSGPWTSSGDSSSPVDVTGLSPGTTYSVRLRAINGQAPGDPSLPTEFTTLVPPANTSIPTITGTARVGEPLTADKGTWTGSPDPTFSYQWQRCEADGNDCVHIPGADDPTYNQTRDDVGRKLRVEVTATNDAGSGEAFSDPYGTVVGSPENTSVATISGSAAVGQSLTAAPGQWSAFPPPTFAYQWQRCEADGNDCANIPGADDLTYALTGQDQGKRMRIRVTASNSAGSAEAFSAVTDSVKPRPAARLSRPTIKGPARAKLRKPVTYRVTVKNTGDATATGVRLSIRGRGVSVNVPEGTIAPGRSRTVKVKVRFRKPGRVKATVKATAKNAATTQAVKQVRVVR